MGYVQAQGLGDAQQARGVTEGCGATVEAGAQACLAAGLHECTQHLHGGGVDACDLAGIQGQLACLLQQWGEAVLSSAVLSMPRSPPSSTVLIVAPDKRFRDP